MRRRPRPYRSSRRVCLTLLTLAACTAPAVVGCGRLPADPEGTFERVQSEPIRVGVIHAPPFSDARALPPTGPEADLVERFADRLGTDIEWHTAGVDELMARLKSFELDIVIGGLRETTPWGAEVALTRPWLVVEHRYVWAVPPGENRWLVELSRFLEGAQRTSSEQSADFSEP